jgi:uncharacterized protein (TIGR02302 family)
MAGGAPGRYGLLLRLAGVSLAWERLWPRLWPAAAMIGLFLALALFDVFPHLPAWLHGAILVVFAVAQAAVVDRAIGGLRPVSRSTARRRIETDSGLDHRPLAALEDRLATGSGDPATERLWQRHRERAAAAARTLSLRPPNTRMAAREPWGLRAGVIIALVIALAAAGGDAPSRLRHALIPAAGGGASPPTVEVWVRPPAYTRTAPLFLTGAGTDTGATGLGTGEELGEGAVSPSSPADGDALVIPAGSSVLARVAGVGRPPVLAIGDVETPFTAVDGTNDGPAAFRSEAIIVPADRLAVRTAGGHALAAWPITVRADEPPTATLAVPDETTDPIRMHLQYQASDDYGLETIAAVIDPPETEPPDTVPLRIEMPLAATGERAVAASEFADLTAHPWAGQPVAVRVEATDALGQRGASQPIILTMPERSFTHPVAQAIIAERKRLLSVRGDALRLPVADALEALSVQPAHFCNDVTVSLGFAVAQARLRHDHGPRALAQVGDVLWQLALRLDQGDVPFAETALQDARNDLWSALRRDAPADEIERLMDRLQEAVERYMAAIAAEMARQGQAMMPLDPDATVLSADHLSDLIEMARQFARAGARDDARRLLAELQKMLDSIRSGLQSGPGQSDLAEAHAMMQTLRDLAQRQRALIDDTFQQARERRQTQKQTPDGRHDVPEITGDQADLRRALAELTEKVQAFLGSVPAPLPEADQGMEGALDALTSGRLDDALQGQGDAADALQRAIGAMGQAMAQRLGAGMGAGMFGENPDEGSGDPFGRPGADGIGGLGVDRFTLPDQADIKRADEILNELRRRANQRSRPVGELDYIERLLKQF